MNFVYTPQLRATARESHATTREREQLNQLRVKIESFENNLMGEALGYDFLVVRYAKVCFGGKASTLKG